MVSAKPLKFVQVISSTNASFGGPAVGAVGLGSELRSCGVESVLLSAAYTAPGGEVAFGAMHSAHRGEEIYKPSRPHTWENSFGLLWALIWEIRSADAVHLHGMYRPATTFAYLMARVWRKPYGLQPHGNLEPYQRRVSARKKKYFDRLVTNGMLSRATYVMFASDSEADRAADRVPREQWLITPLGCYLDEPAPPVHHSAFNRVNQADDEKVVLFLGRLASKKRPDLLLEAWSLIPKGERGLLVLCGPNGDFTKERLEHFAARLEVADTVVVWGAADGAEKSWLYDKANVFVLPSENENFGIAVAEAMLGSCHVITTSEVAASVHVGKSASGEVLSTLRAGSVAGAILRALRDPVGSRSSGMRAKDYAATELSWRPAANAIIERLVEGGPGRGSQ